MRKKLLIIYLFPLLAALQLPAQKKYCADSSIRIKYSFNYPFAKLINNEDTAGANVFVGSFTQIPSSPGSGIIAMRTNWGDSIYWEKRYYLNNINTRLANSFNAPGGTVIGFGFYGNNTGDMLLCKMDTSNGNMLWTKRYRLTNSHTGTNGGLANYKNVIISNNAIYFNVDFYGGNKDLFVIGKADLDGNLIWTKAFDKNISSNKQGFGIDAAVLLNDTLFVVSNVSELDISTGNVTKMYPVITKLKDADGIIIESIALKPVIDNTVKGVFPNYFRLNNNNTFSMVGEICVQNPTTGITPGSDKAVQLVLDKNLNPIISCYYNPTSPNFIDGSQLTYDFNSQNQHALLYSEIPPANIKYFVSFDANKDITRCRKLLLPPNYGRTPSTNFDDKQDVHFIFDYRINGKAVVEYARISDLAPANTVSCFGVDTSFLTKVPFTTTKEAFTWDNEYTNIVSSFPVTLIEEPETITKQVVCKQVSYCDSLKIKGVNNISICPTKDVRYTAYLNPQCLKSVVWKPDTSMATVINTEADSAATIRFKKPGQFYLKALVNNCVVADSILITVTKPQTALQLTKTDSLLCPGKTILLQVNPFFKTYQWQDGSNQNSYTVTAPGLYTITATDSCGNVVTDSIRIKQDSTVIPIAPYYKICVYDTVNVLLPDSISNITWQPPLYGSLSMKKLSLYPLQTTAYTIQAQSPQGCNLQKLVTVETELCPEWVRFPSAFTPNNDGLNDSFKPGVSGHLVSYNLKVFDRNGQMVFISNNPFAGWDGRLKGTEQNSGVFVFISYYRFTNKAEVMQKGTLMLIR